MISMIWAMDESNLIGSKNKMPWHVKEDLLYYKETTKAHPVIMGYNTYLSMLGYYKDRPFPYKKTYVLTHNEFEDDRVEIVHDPLLFMNNMKDEDLFVVGGKALYTLLLPYADKLYISYIKGVHEGDTYIDFLNLNEFDLASERTTDLVRYTIYNRKK